MQAAETAPCLDTLRVKVCSTVVSFLFGHFCLSVQVKAVVSVLSSCFVVQQYSARHIVPGQELQMSFCSLHIIFNAV